VTFLPGSSPATSQATHTQATQATHRPHTGHTHRPHTQATHTGHPQGVALLYTPIPLRCGRTGAPSRVGPPLAGGLPDAASVTCFALAPASGNASGVALLYTIRSCRWWRAVYSRATPCGWPVGVWLVGGLCVWPVRVACGWLVGGLWVACGCGLWVACGWPVGGLWVWPVGVATSLPCGHWPAMWPLVCHVATGLPCGHWSAMWPLACGCYYSSRKAFLSSFTKPIMPSVQVIRGS